MSTFKHFKSSVALRRKAARSKMTTVLLATLVLPLLLSSINIGSVNADPLKEQLYLDNVSVPASKITYRDLTIEFTPKVAGTVYIVTTSSSGADADLLWGADVETKITGLSVKKTVTIAAGDVNKAKTVTIKFGNSTTEVEYDRAAGTNIPKNDLYLVLVDGDGNMSGIYGNGNGYGYIRRPAGPFTCTEGAVTNGTIKTTTYPAGAAATTIGEGDVIKLTYEAATGYQASPKVKVYEAPGGSDRILKEETVGLSEFTLADYDVKIDVTFQPTADQTAAIAAKAALIAAATAGEFDVTEDALTSKDKAGLEAWLTNRINSIKGMAGTTLSELKIYKTDGTTDFTWPATLPYEYKFSLELQKGNSASVVLASTDLTTGGNIKPSAADDANFTAFKTAVEALTATNWTVKQEISNGGSVDYTSNAFDRVKWEINEIIRALSNPANVSWSIESFAEVTPVAVGSSGTPSGTDGVYAFDLKLTKGSLTYTVANKRLTITAKAWAPAAPTTITVPSLNGVDNKVDLSKLNAIVSPLDPADPNVVETYTWVTGGTGFTTGTIDESFITTYSASRSGAYPGMIVDKKQFNNGTSTASTVIEATGTRVEYFALVVKREESNKLTGGGITYAISNEAVVDWRYAATPTASDAPNITSDLSTTLLVGTVGTPIKLEVVATSSDGGNLSYQWFTNTSASAAGATAITGATGSSYTPPFTTANATSVYYYVVVKNEKDPLTAATTTSQIAGITWGWLAAPASAADLQKILTVTGGATPPTDKVYNALRQPINVTSKGNVASLGIIKVFYVEVDPNSGLPLSDTTTTAPEKAGSYRVFANIGGSNDIQAMNPDIKIDLYANAYGQPLYYKIDQKGLTVSVSNETILKGSAFPTPTITYDGFVGTDSKNNTLTALATATFGALDANTAGTYTIEIAGAVLNSTAGANYYIKEYKTGTLTIVDNFTVTIHSTTGGGVSADLTTAQPNEKVTLTILPLAGYTLDAIYAYQTDAPDKPVTLSGSGATRTFTMPAANVTVSAIFLSPDEQALKKDAGDLIKKALFNVDQAEANTQAAVEAWLKSTINELIKSTGATVSSIVFNNFEAAVAGDVSNIAGENGAFRFRLTLTKGTASLAFSDLIGFVVATPFGDAIDDIQAQALKVYVQDGVLRVTGLTSGTTWSVYSISGALIGQQTADSAEGSIILPARGFYLVKSGKNTTKVAF